MVSDEFIVDCVDCLHYLGTNLKSNSINNTYQDWKKKCKRSMMYNGNYYFSQIVLFLINKKVIDAYDGTFAYSTYYLMKYRSFVNSECTYPCFSNEHIKFFKKWVGEE